MNEKVKSGFVAVIGRPNAGKSTLLNWIVGEKLTIVSHKANATRKRATIIMMHKNHQIIFIDTPGIHERERVLNQFMLEEAIKALGDCELILFLAPITDKIENYQKFLELNRKNTPHILLLTKIDLVTKEEIIKKIEEYNKFSDKFLSLIPISTKKENIKEILLDEIIKYLPQHPYYYDPEILTTQNLKEIYKEFIREAIFENTSDEVPYFSDVIIDRVEENNPKIEKIFATIIVDSRTQKGIIIGREGKTLKRIGKLARILIENLIEKRVYLKLFVTIKKGWSKDKKALKELGYQ